MNTHHKLSAFALGSALLLTSAASADAGASDAVSLPPSLAPCEMDYDNSGTIDFGDFLHVMSNWGTESSSGPDLGDEQTTAEKSYGFAELLEVINNYGRRCKRR
jgi:hypothetical protein